MAKELHENKDTEERLILVGIELEDKDSPSAMAVEACLDELEELVNTAGATAVARTIQRREKVHPAHYLGKGKIEELKMMINTYDATGIICDDELSPAQLKNLEKCWKQRSWTEPSSFWIFLPDGLFPAKGKFR